MSQEADAPHAYPLRDTAADLKRPALKLVASRAVVAADETGVDRPSLPGRPAFMVRDERFASLHPREVYSRLRRRGSYVFHC